MAGGAAVFWGAAPQQTPLAPLQLHPEPALGRRGREWTGIAPQHCQHQPAQLPVGGAGSCSLHHFCISCLPALSQKYSPAQALLAAGKHCPGAAQLSPGFQLPGSLLILIYSPTPPSAPAGKHGRQETLYMCVCVSLAAT